MFTWKPDAIPYQKDEFSQNPMYRDIARAIVRHGSGTTLLDAGSGLGFLSAAFASLGCSVIAVEQNPLVAASAVFPTRVEDVHQLSPSLVVDTVACCNFGSTVECLELGEIHASKTLCLVRQNWGGHRFRPDAPESNPASRTAMMLDALSIPWEEEQVTVEAGQRFRSRADAVRFFQLWGNDTVPPLQVQAGSFPFLYHREGVMRLFFIRRSDIPTIRTNHLLVISGSQGIGKSTLRTRLVAQCTAPQTGFLTHKQDDVVVLDGISSNIHGIVGKPGQIRADGFDTLGVQALQTPGKLRIMDELGYMERDALRFQKAVRDALHDGVDTIAVVKDRSTPFLDAIRSDAASLCVHLTPENRNAVTEDLLRSVTANLNWPLGRRLNG